jgi:uncharacterized protein
MAGAGASMNLSPTTEAKRDALLRRLRAHGSVLVAFSGGVDSATLLKAAVEALGPGKALGVTVTGAIFPSHEVELAQTVAREHNLPHRLVEASPLGMPAFDDNSPERCYHCKRFLFTQLLELARREGFACVVDGANADDLGDHRPGMRATGELGVASPFKELDVTKAQIREMAHAWGLRNWDEPSAACLASRIPYGQPITLEKLRRVDQAESFLRRAFGLRCLRVRHDGLTARIEAAPEAIARLAEPEARALIVERLREIGFRYVSLDLTGYRTGSLNEVL